MWQFFCNRGRRQEAKGGDRKLTLQISQEEITRNKLNIFYASQKKLWQFATFIFVLDGFKWKNIYLILSLVFRLVCFCLARGPVDSTSAWRPSWGRRTACCGWAAAPAAWSSRQSSCSPTARSGCSTGWGSPTAFH